ncbi:MAG: glycosyl hydrolase family 18 protein [Lachnospiraceae bacterium]
MMRRLLPMFIAIGLLILIAAGYMGVQIIERYTPSDEWMEASDAFDVEKDAVALILNDEKSEARGLYINETTYLPLEWVNSNLNKRFYWDEGEKILSYALPTEIRYADSTTVGEDGKPLLWVTDQEVFLSLNMVAAYTDIAIGAFDTKEAKRVFINNTWASESWASVEKDCMIRQKGGIKSPIITRAEAGTQVKVLEQMEKWSKVRTQDGFIGYIENKRLGEIQNITPKSDFEEPEYTRLALDEKVVLAWHQVTTKEANSTFDSYYGNTKGVNVISPTWFALTDNEGNYKCLADSEYVKKAHDAGVSVWALIDNFSKDVQSEVLLSKTSVRKKLIHNLMADAKKYGFDGYNLDFESLKESAGPHYVQFIREMSAACRNNGLILSVDNYVPAAYNRFYDRKEQGIVADYVIVMGYDEHYAGGEPGSVASIDYVKKGIENTLLDVPREKVINAIPFYTRLWTETEDGEITSEAMGIEKAQKWIEENQVELYWQDSLGQYYGEKGIEGGSQYLWMEEEKSLKLKMDVIRDNDLGGVGCWKLGFEPASIWDIITFE